MALMSRSLSFIQPSITAPSFAIFMSGVVGDAVGR